jgi:hypothetical protein
MYNITILRDEIAFLREAIVKKYCAVIKEDPQHFLRRITGSIKYYEAIGEMMREQLLDVNKVSDYAARLTESPFKITLRKWLQEKDVERSRRLGELGLSTSANVLRKLIFYGSQEPELTFKDMFIMACYIYTGIDRSEWLSRRNAPVSSAPETFDKSSGTLPPGAFRQDTGDRRQETVAPYSENIRCSLVAIDDNEQRTDEVLQLEFTGKPLILNRNNLGPDNNTITSQVQAMLRYKEGKWELENGSRYKTTYIQVIKAATIQKGDIIVFGNKRFLFLEGE